MRKQLKIYARYSEKGKRRSIHIRSLIPVILLFWSLCLLNGQEYIPIGDPAKYILYPEVQDVRPELYSPFKMNDGKEYLVAVTTTGKFALIDVTLSNERDICKQLIIDTADFPQLTQTGLHNQEDLSKVKTITGLSIAEITASGHPGALSTGGFLADDEDIISVIKGDNLLVQKMGFTHPQMAKPLFHVLNMMDTDLHLDRWNMSRHEWENIHHFYYHGQEVFVQAFDTKGGQKSIFDDRLQGAFHIKLWRALTNHEKIFLKRKYHHLSPDQFDEMVRLLSTINTGEMEPQYIMRYGFYEGHTFWRVDPVAIAFIFGLKNIQYLELLFNGRLDQVLSNHFTQTNELR